MGFSYIKNNKLEKQLENIMKLLSKMSHGQRYFCFFFFLKIRNKHIIMIRYKERWEIPLPQAQWLHNSSQKVGKTIYSRYCTSTIWRSHPSNLHLPLFTQYSTIVESPSTRKLKLFSHSINAKISISKATLAKQS